MGKREKRERRKAERIAADARRQAERRDRWRRETLMQRCPECGEGEVSRFLYGWVLDFAALEDEIDSELVVLAGSSFSGSDPLWICRICRHKSGSIAETLGT
jgi:hypothetical protein